MSHCKRPWPAAVKPLLGICVSGFLVTSLSASAAAPSEEPGAPGRGGDHGQVSGQRQLDAPGAGTCPEPADEDTASALGTVPEMEPRVNEHRLYPGENRDDLTLNPSSTGPLDLCSAGAGADQDHPGPGHPIPSPSIPVTLSGSPIPSPSIPVLPTGTPIPTPDNGTLTPGGPGSGSGAGSSPLPSLSPVCTPAAVVTPSCGLGTAANSGPGPGVNAGQSSAVLGTTRGAYLPNTNGMTPSSGLALPLLLLLLLPPGLIGAVGAAQRRRERALPS